MITVLLVDDNDLVRKSLCSLLELTEDIQVVATASNGVEAVAKARLYRPDVAVMDISMPIMNGIEATENIRECCRLTRVILVTGFDNPEYVQQALEVGATGYVLKDTVGDDLPQAIHAIYRGSEYFSEKISRIASGYLASKGDDSSGA